MRGFSQQEFLEFKKCRLSPAYFIHNYVKMKDPMLGCIPFHLYKYQEIVLSKFLQNPFNLILKARQMGLSWLVAAYALWLCLFFEDKRVLMISIKDATAKALLKKVKYIYDRLPEFLQGELTDCNMSRLAFNTGSDIESVPTSEEAGRSDSLSLLIIDEAAFVRWIEHIWQAAYPTLSTGGSAIVLSTPNGTGNFYHKLWQKSIEGQSLFNPIRLHWYYYPNRDKEWLRIQRMNMSTLQLAQEVLADFISSGNLVFDIAALRALVDECSMIEPYAIDYAEEKDTTEACGLYYFEEPDRYKDYILCADTAKGGAGDFHAAHVLDKYTGLQVAEFRSKVPLEVFNRRIFELGMKYNHALAAVENNNMGIATNLYLKQNDYPRIYEYQNPLKPNLSELGFPTNALTRPLLIDELEVSIRQGVSGVRGIRTVNELMNFAWQNGKAEALTGNHDDLVMSLGIGRFVRKMHPGEVDMPMLLS